MGGGISRFDFNAAYAVWNGKTWAVQYGDDGCPKLLAGVQAPAPVHIGNPSGAARYPGHLASRTPEILRFNSAASGRVVANRGAKSCGGRSIPNMSSIIAPSHIE